MNIAIFLEGSVSNDGRVLRIISTLSQNHKIDLFYYNGLEEDSKLFNSNVCLINHTYKISWFQKNIFFNKKFKSLKESVLKKRMNYDYIYCNDYPLLETAVELKNSIGSKLIYDSHEIYIETINQFFPTKGWKAIYGKPLIKLNQVIHFYKEKSLINKADIFITVCDSFLKYFKKTYNLEKGIVIRNCPDIQRFPIKNKRLHNLLSLNESDRILLYQGDVNIGRGLEKIIMSSKFFNDNIHFVILGGGSKFNLFKEWSTVNKLSKVHFLSKVPFRDLLNYTASADAGILLIERYNKSKELTLPNKVFEYMAAGIPVITNDLPEASKIINEFICGVTIDDSTPESIADEINIFFERDAFENLFGTNGQIAIEKSLNWNNEIIKLTRILE